MIIATKKGGKTALWFNGDKREIVDEFLDILVFLTAQSNDKVGFVSKLCEYLQSENFANSVKRADDYRKKANDDKH